MVKLKEILWSSIQSMTALFLVLPLPLMGAVLDQEDWSAVNAPWALGYSPTPLIDPSPSGGSSPSGGPAIKFTAPQGGTGMGEIYGQAVRSGNGLGNDFYIGFWIKYSTNWLWNPIGSKLMYIMAQADPDSLYGPENEPNLLIAMGGDGNQKPSGSPSGGLLITQQTTWDHGTQYFLNYPVQNHYSMQLNHWYWWQIHVKMNDPGVANGQFELWIGDPATGIVTKSITYNQLALRARRAAAGFASFYHGIVYGGGPNAPLPNDQYMWVDHTVIATTQAETNMPGGTPPPANVPTDINGDGTTNVTDVQLGVNQAIKITNCGNADVNNDGACNVVDVQQIVNKALNF